MPNGACSDYIHTTKKESRPILASELGVLRLLPEGYGVAVATTLPAFFYICDSSWSASVEALLKCPDLSRRCISWLAGPRLGNVLPCSSDRETVLLVGVQCCELRASDVDYIADRTARASECTLLCRGLPYYWCRACSSDSSFVLACHALHPRRATNAKSFLM